MLVLVSENGLVLLDPLLVPIVTLVGDIPKVNILLEEGTLLNMEEETLTRPLLLVFTPSSSSSSPLINGSCDNG